MPTAELTYFLIAVTVLVSYLGFRSYATSERLVLDSNRVIHGREYRRLFTAGFLHADWMHLIFNMISLYLFGPLIEMVLGPLRYLVIYLASIVGGNVVALWLNRGRSYRALGASGGVSGVMFAAVVLFPEMRIQPFLIPIPLPAWLWAVAFVLASLYGMRTRWTNVGHEAHLGGALIGLALTIALVPQTATRYPVLVVGLAAGAVALLVSSTHSARRRKRSLRSRSWWAAKK